MKKYLMVQTMGTGMVFFDLFWFENNKRFQVVVNKGEYIPVEKIDHKVFLHSLMHGSLFHAIQNGIIQEVEDKTQDIPNPRHPMSQEIRQDKNVVKVSEHATVVVEHKAPEVEMKVTKKDSPIEEYNKLSQSKKVDFVKSCLDKVLLQEILALSDSKQIKNLITKKIKSF